MPYSLRAIRLFSLVLVFGGATTARLQARDGAGVPGSHACVFCANFCANLEVFCASQICALDNHRCIVTGECEGVDHVVYSTVNVCNEAET